MSDVGEELKTGEMRVFAVAHEYRGMGEYGTMAYTEEQGVKHLVMRPDPREPVFLYMEPGNIAVFSDGSTCKVTLSDWTPPAAPVENPRPDVIFPSAVFASGRTVSFEEWNGHRFVMFGRFGPKGFYYPQRDEDAF